MKLSTSSRTQQYNLIGLSTQSTLETNRSSSLSFSKSRGRTQGVTCERTKQKLLGQRLHGTPYEHDTKIQTRLNEMVRI